MISGPGNHFYDKKSAFSCLKFYAPKWGRETGFEISHVPRDVDKDDEEDDGQVSNNRESHTPWCSLLKRTHWIAR